MILGNKPHRYLILDLQRGDLLLEKITEEVNKAGIKDAVILCGIGALQKVVYHRVTSFSNVPEEEFVTIEKPLELGSLQGMFVDGQPHIHIVCSDENGTYAGHLEPGTTVLYLAEITVMELPDTNLARVKTANNIGIFTDKTSGKMIDQ
ncbi:DNA-binding protein [Mobilitalea sibirica]|uniref:DNA-binding protein n=1 Tax=Mobilitalea sibirica TaxID=1462919 RepID=A0A8J7HA13_9FIRM|nr:PPC domain-containing DNA-binding protein [Mobilitalea sibirica]MBH1939491.1 DNA-binding protein [Mobilitalea sibirica]